MLMLLGMRSKVLSPITKSIIVCVECVCVCVCNGVQSISGISKKQLVREHLEKDGNNRKQAAC